MKQLIADLMNCEFHNWTRINSHVLSELQFHCISSDNQTNCCWFAFEIWISLMQSSIILWKCQKFLVLKLSFHTTLYRRENVQFWWMTRRWIAEILNFQRKPRRHYCFLSIIYFAMKKYRIKINYLMKERIHRKIEKSVFLKC